VFTKESSATITTASRTSSTSTSSGIATSANPKPVVLWATVASRTTAKAKAPAGPDTGGEGAASQCSGEGETRVGGR
jgi:hypothetical protein